MPVRNETEFITQQALGAYLDLSSKNVRELRKRGVIPCVRVQSNRFKYKPDECRVAYIKHLRQQAAGRSERDLQNPQYSTARTEREREQARKVRMENDIREGRYLPAEEVEENYVGAMHWLRVTMDGVAGRIGGGDAVLRQRVLKELRTVLREFAEKLEVTAWLESEPEIK